MKPTTPLVTLMKTPLERYLELSDYGKMKYLEERLKDLKSALKDSNKFLEETEQYFWDEKCPIKAQLTYNENLIRSLPL